MSQDELVTAADLAAADTILATAAPSTNGSLPHNEHTWQAIDLVAAAANPPEPPTIAGILYPAKRAVLSGERDSLKTWLALLLCKAELDAGCAVAWADMDAMGPGSLLERLRLLGLPDDVISDRFVYYAPAERLKADRLDDVAAELRYLGVRLMVCDAFNPFLNLHGLDPNSTTDVETFWREVADPICRAGAAPLMLDHVVKNAESRSHYAYGSERKASGAIVHLGTRIVAPFGRGRTGTSVIDCHRDRQGYLPRPRLGLLELVGDELGVTYQLKPEPTSVDGTFRPTHLMQKISDHLSQQFEPVSQTHIEQNVTGDDKAKRIAVKLLAAEGYASASTGPRNAILMEHVRAYREDEDEKLNPGGNPGETTVNQGSWDPSLTSVGPGALAPDTGVKNHHGGDQGEPPVNHDDIELPE